MPSGLGRLPCIASHHRHHLHFLLRSMTIFALFRNTLGLLGSEGYDAIAPDWVGHGDSSKEGPGFDCSEEAYKKALGGFIDGLGLGKPPMALIVHVGSGAGRAQIMRGGNDVLLYQ